MGGDNHHPDQCNCIPEEFGQEDRIHLVPCYKKFTLILSGQSSRQEDVPQERRKSNRTPQAENERTGAWVYPPECNICKKLRVQHNNKRVLPVKIATFQCAETIKAAAKEKNPDMYYEILDLDIVAKEFKMHDHCRKSFLKEFGEETREKSKEINPSIQVCFSIFSYMD